MFTCDYENMCKKKEALARKKYLGDAKGLQLLIRKITWRPWIRNKAICNSGCPLWGDFQRELYTSFLQKNGEWIRNLK